MTLKDLQKEAHAVAKEKGWHDEPRSIAHLIALCHSELSEALEVCRKGWDVRYIEAGAWNGFSRPGADERGVDDSYFTCGCPVKPEGLPIELADLIIRVVDMAELLGIDLEEAIKIKMAYNRTRSYKHGKKF